MVTDSINNTSSRSEENISYDIIIPTFKPGAEFAKLLRSLALQVLAPDNIFIVNTEEKYWNTGWEKEYPSLKVMHIKKSEFDHGASRHMAAKCSKADVLVFMTQDALPADEDMTLNLIRPISEGKAELAYGRQVARADADLIERFTRNFNYPPESRIKSSADLKELGVKTFFCTNVCSAYLRKIYFELGGFPRPVILNEDSILSGRAITAGYRLAYAADARVIHSHNYSGLQQFKRNFDIGVSHAMYASLFGAFASENEGVKLVKQTIRYVTEQKKPYLIFKVIWLSGWKYLGYKFGKKYKKLPKFLVKKWSMNPLFWEKKLGTKGGGANV